MTLPNLSFENALHKKGYKIIAGADEVGRGCFAGPVVAAAVAFAPFSNFHFPISNKNSDQIVINDSKKLTPKQREVADVWIRKNALAFGIGTSSVLEINKFGIKKATQTAYRRAIYNTNKSVIALYNSVTAAIDFLLVDAFYVPYLRGLKRKNQLPIIHGDGISFSIAAASILAKVYRDGLMSILAENSIYKNYKWHKNKGYGTKEHRDLILKYGTTTLHRNQFVETWMAKI